MVRVNRVIPKEWTRYSPLGKVIPRTRFVVFKTPLNDRLANKLPKDNRFNVSDLLWMLAQRNEKLGMVIDLTDTDRYYDSKDFEGMCIEHEKINCPGRGFVENEDHVEDFNQAVQKFISNSDDDDTLIGVHCTHGVNRSGYLICRFLIEKLQWSSHEALQAFEEARGHPIANGSYVQALHKAAVQRMNDSESDDSSRKKKKKSKKRKYEKNEDLMAQFLGKLEEQALGLDSNSGYDSPQVYPGSNVESPSQHAWASHKKRRVREVVAEEPEPEEAEELEEGDGGAEEEVQYGEDGEPVKLSRNQRRRRNQKHMNDLLHTMKRGNFNDIKEAQERLLLAREKHLQQQQQQQQQS